MKASGARVLRLLSSHHVEICRKCLLLHEAAKYDDLETAELLLHLKADENAVNLLGMTPLQLTAKQGGEKVVHFFLGRGFDPRWQNAHGTTLEILSRAERHFS